MSQIKSMLLDPKAEPQRRRSEVMKLRLTPDELEYLTEQATLAGVSRTDFIMAAAKGTPIVVIEDIPKMLQELRRQGTNLNQAVALAHKKQSTNLPELMAAVHACVETQAEIMRLCHGWEIKLIARQEGDE